MLSATTGRQICSGFEAKYKPNNNWSNLTFIKVQQAPALLASQIDRSEPEKFALKMAQSKDENPKPRSDARNIVAAAASSGADFEDQLAQIWENNKK